MQHILRDGNEPVIVRVKGTGEYAHYTWSTSSGNRAGLVKPWPWDFEELILPHDRVERVDTHAILCDSHYGYMPPDHRALLARKPRLRRADTRALMRAEANRSVERAMAKLSHAQGCDEPRVKVA